MGRLPCRRPRRTESSKTESALEPQHSPKRAAKNDDGTTVLLIEDEDERVQLQRLSRPSRSLHEDTISITPLNGPSSSIQNAKDSVKAKRVEQRRRRLEDISGRLRRRLSRDPRWPDPSSNVPEMRKHRVRSLLLPANAGAHRRPSVLDHALGSGLVNENEYDSDAQCISTPKGSIQTGQLSGTRSSNRSPRSLPRERESTIREESEQFGSTVEQPDRPRIDNDESQEGGQNDRVEQLRLSPSVSGRPLSAKQPSTKSSTDEVIGRQAEEEIQYKRPHDTSSDNSGLRSHSHEGERLDQGTSPSPSLHTPVIVHKDSMSLMRARGLSMIKAPDDMIHSNESSCIGDDAFSTEITKIQISGTLAATRSCAGSPSSFTSNQPPLSAFDRSQSHLRSLSESDGVRLHEMNISKRLASASTDYPTSSGDQLPLSWTRQEDRSIFRSSLQKGSTRSEAVSTTEAPRVNPSENNQRGRNISSLYLSQTSSLLSSYGNSVNELRLEVPAPSYSKDAIVLSKRNGKTKGARRYSAFPSDLFSPKEDSRTAAADNPLLAFHDSVVPQTSGTQSKFKEQFEPDSPDTHTAAVEYATDTKSTVSRSVSVGWMSGGRRLGYGYTFVPDEGTEGSKPRVSDMPSDDNPAAPAGRPRLGSQRRNHSKELSTDKEKSLLSPNVPLSVDGMAERPFCNDSCTESGEIRELRGRKSRQHSSLREKTEQLWAKFPSHSRAERSGSATYSDDVIVRDFYFRPDPDDIMRRELGKKERGASGGKSRKFLHRWSRLYRSKSVEARRYRAGFTVEAAKCREPNFPELQIPRGAIIPRKEQLGDYREEVRKYEIWMKLKNERASRVELSNSTSMEGPSTGLQQISVENESLTRTPGFTQAGGSGKENLGQESPSTAQEWSRVYEECVETPDDEIDQEQQPPASARDERDRPTSARGHLPNSDSDLQGSQVAEESQPLTG